MATKIQCGRLLICDAALKKDSGKPYSQEAAMAKYYHGDSCNDVTCGALWLRDGYGFIRDYDIEGMYRDARIVSIYEGTSETQRVVISGHILGE